MNGTSRHDPVFAGPESKPAIVDLLASDNQWLCAEVRRLQGLLNTPEVDDFMKAVPLEAAHQRERWGEEHDARKSGEAWVFLFGFLAGKAVQAAKSGDSLKAKHHAITAAAALANFHRLVAAGHRVPE